MFKKCIHLTDNVCSFIVWWYLVSCSLLVRRKRKYSEFSNILPYLRVQYYTVTNLKIMFFTFQMDVGAAAALTVELTARLGRDYTKQHREVQGHESDLFRSYFQNGNYTIYPPLLFTDFNALKFPSGKIQGSLFSWIGWVDVERLNS